MEQISLRRIQHFLYCPHRWGLCEIEQLWADNLFVAQADLMHERVHDPDYVRVGRGIKTYCGVSVYHDGTDYGLYGVTDCIEARADPDEFYFASGEVSRQCRRRNAWKCTSAPRMRCVS